MAALWNRAGHYIFVLWFVLLSICLLLFFSGLFSVVADWISTILPHMVGYRSETCCTRLTGTAGRKKSPKIRHMRTIAQLCRAISSQLRHVLTIGKKLVKQQYLLHMSPQYGELGPLTAEICWWIWGSPANFNRLSVLAASLHGSVVVGVSQTLWNWTESGPLYAAGRPSRWALAHILVLLTIIFNSNNNSLEWGLVDGQRWNSISVHRILHHKNECICWLVKFKHFVTFVVLEV